MPISGNEFLVLLLLAALLVGPERLPQFAEQIARLVRQVRQLTSGARSRIQEELGPEFDDVDWSQFDPRRYDPRRIVREALLEDAPPMKPQSGPGPGAAGPGRARSANPAAADAGAGTGTGTGTGAVPFDDEAT